MFPPESPTYNVYEYGHYRVGDRVIHRKNLTRGVIQEMEVFDNVVNIWVLWEGCPFSINMHWDHIMKL